MKLVYTRRAAAEFAETLGYLDKRSPRGAHRIELRIQQVTMLISQHPATGSLTSGRRLRRIAVRPYPYVVYYEMLDTAVVVHGVRHSARDPGSAPQ